MYTVYAHRNLKNGKYYIGMTSLEPKKRWNSGLGYKKQQKMWNDIKESDWNKDWEHTILGKFEDKDEALNVEKIFIWLFDSTNDGYNTSSYGSGNYERTEKQKRKMSEAHTGEKNHMFGKHHSEETKKKMSDNHADFSGEKAYWYGKHHSEESKKKIRENNPSKAVIQLSKDGEFIAEYPSTHEAERHTGCNQGNICKCCKGKYKSTGGFIWKYK